MDTLKRLFMNAEICIRGIVEKISGKQFLTEQDCAEMVRLTMEICQEQERCMKMLKEAGVEETECQSIEELEGLWNLYRQKEERKKRILQSRRIVEEFLSIQTPMEDYRLELERIQSALRVYDDEMLLQMEENGDLRHYQEFVDCIKTEQPDKELVYKLADKFGRPLAFALLYHELEFSGCENAEKTIVAPKEGVSEVGNTWDEKNLSNTGNVLDQGDSLNLESNLEEERIPNPEYTSSAGMEELAVGSSAKAAGASFTDKGGFLVNNKTYLLEPIRPLRKRDITTKMLRGDLKGLSLQAKTLLVMLRQFAVLNAELAMELSHVGEKHDYDQEDLIIHKKQFECTFETLLEKGLVAGYRTEEHDVLYCLTEYGYQLTFLKGSEGDFVKVKNKYRKFSVLLENRRILGTAQMRGDILRLVFGKTHDMARYLTCIWEHKDRLRLDKKMVDEIIGSFCWDKDHYIVKVFMNRKSTLCPVYHTFQSYPGTGVALFLTAVPPEGPFDQTKDAVFFCDGENCYYWAHGWISIAEEEAVENKKVKENETVGTMKVEEKSEQSVEIVGTKEKSRQAAENMKAEEKKARITETTKTVPLNEELVYTNEQTPTAQQTAKHLLEQPNQIKMEHLFRLTIQLIVENRFAEAAVLAETLAKAPNVTIEVERFYQVFRHCVQMPGSVYHYSSDAIGQQQGALPEDDLELRSLQQTMILSILLWAMAFPSVPYDHSLYNNVEMAVSADEIQPVRELVALLSEELKEVSFKNDGLGFSPIVISSLVNNGEREHQMKEICKKATELRPTPTSNVSITGLETCLKQMVGPTSVVGKVLLWVEKDDQKQLEEAERILGMELGEDYQNSDSSLEAYIDRCWSALHRDDPHVKVKYLNNDTTARKQCKKALTDRLKLIESWFGIVKSERESKFGQYRERYARILNQVKTSLGNLLKDTEHHAPGITVYEAAGRNILHMTAEKMLAALEKTSQGYEEQFYDSLCQTPELMLGENGENVIISELYGVSGMEPWSFVLRAVAAQPESPEEILGQIDNYQASRWYRNYGMEALLSAYTGKECPDRTQGIQNAERDAEQVIQTFKSNTRLNRAYGKIQESTMETAFSMLDIVKQFYFRTHNYASFKIFLARMEALLDCEIENQVVRYEKRIQELEADSHFVGAPMLEVIRQALANKNFNSVDSYINQLQSGIRELPVNEKKMELKGNFLSQFQRCEEGYYKVCQSQQYRSKNPARWGEQALESMGKEYQHWTSPNEKKKGCTWLSNWIMHKDDKSNAARVSSLLTGLGFRVQDVKRDDGVKPMVMYELFLVSAERTSAGLKDYPHPIYKFGTELSDPMYVVCLYGCKGESTLINVMTNELQLNGPTIVLMDGALKVSGRRLIARKFKADTSGQSPFLLIDRVLLLYLASLNEGDRQNAMLHCTLPYTFEVLYGNGSGAVPEEMFIGRISEMNDLRSEQGPSLVYGGRQLGKTALLNRASKTINDPKNKDYSFCVDVKDESSTALLEKVNRQLCKLKLLEAPCTSLKEMCDMLQEAYDEGKIRKLRVFVDESDKMFEEFRQNDYEALRPFIVMRDDTKHHIKFVFAGTHNVAATENVEEKNSNLLHMGPPLCIEPLSPDDAMKLIRIPMSYLGFEIGDAQIELILSNTNNYPGLIHIFCNALIQSVCRDYESYYSGDKEMETPPYRISDEQMRAVFKEKDIRKEIGTRVMSTIKLNHKYHVISCLLANMVYEDQENEHNRLYGHSARELLEYNRKELQLPLLTGMAEKNLDALLNEMVKMGILWKNVETQQFRFRQQDFLNYIGTNEQVLEFLLEKGMEVET